MWHTAQCQGVPTIKTFTFGFAELRLFRFIKTFIELENGEEEHTKTSKYQNKNDDEERFTAVFVCCLFVCMFLHALDDFIQSVRLETSTIMEKKRACNSAL